MEQERRQYTRFIIDQFVKLSMGREIFIEAEGLNLSRGGLLGRTSAPIENLEKVFVMLNLPFGDGLECVRTEGIVVYTQAEGPDTQFGLRFTDMWDSDQDILDRYLKSLEP